MSLKPGHAGVGGLPLSARYVGGRALAFEVRHDRGGALVVPQGRGVAREAAGLIDQHHAMHLAAG